MSLIRDLNLGSDGSESDSGSSSSDSSSDSESDSGSESDAGMKKKTGKSDKDKIKVVTPVKPEEKPKKRVDEVRPFATCKHCGVGFEHNDCLFFVCV